MQAKAGILWRETTTSFTNSPPERHSRAGVWKRMAKTGFCTRVEAELLAIAIPSPAKKTAGKRAGDREYHWRNMTWHRRNAIWWWSGVVRQTREAIGRRCEIVWQWRKAIRRWREAIWRRQEAIGRWRKAVWQWRKAVWQPCGVLWRGRNVRWHCREVIWRLRGAAWRCSNFKCQTRKVVWHCSNFKCQAGKAVWRWRKGVCRSRGVVWRKRNAECSKKTNTVETLLRVMEVAGWTELIQSASIKMDSLKIRNPKGFVEH